MRYILSILGIVGSFFMIYYREKIGDMLGETDTMRKFGGVYLIVVVIALFIFIWSIAELTNTTDILFKPLLMLFPNSGPSEEELPDF